MILFNADEDRPLGLICAIPDETAHFHGALDIRNSVSVGDLRFECGFLEDVPLVMVESGMGKVNAAMVATVLLDRFNCAGILFSGIAGGLDPKLGVGDVVVATRVVQHDFGYVRDGVFTAYQPGFLPGIRETEDLGYAADPGALAHARLALNGFVAPTISADATGDVDRVPVLRFGPIVAGDTFVDCVATRERLFTTFGAAAVEMEGAAIAQVAEHFNRPWLFARSISDLCGADRERDMLAFLEQTGQAAAAVVSRLLREDGS